MTDHTPPPQTNAPCCSAPIPTRERQCGPSLVAQSAQSGHPPSTDTKTNPMGSSFDYRGSQKTRCGRAEKRPDHPHDRQPGLVACRLGSLWRTDDSHGVALPPAPTAPPTVAVEQEQAIMRFRASELVARQCEPRQGSPTCLWPIKKKYGNQRQLGRPHDRARRQRGLRIDGVEDLRVLHSAREDIWQPENRRLLGVRKANGWHPATTVTVTVDKPSQSHGKPSWPPCRWA